MSLLDEIQGIITDVFSDEELFFYPATVHRVTRTNPNPWGVDVPNPETFDCMALETAFNAHERNASGIPDTDTKILILHNTLATDLRKGDIVRIPGRGDRVVIRFKIDPADAVWVAQARAPDGNGDG